MAVVAVKLDDVTFDNGELTATHATCTLGASVNSASLCVFVYVASGVSMAAGLLLALVMCLTCNLCGLGKYINLLLAVLGTVWWVAAAAVVSHNLGDASTGGSSLQVYRDATIGMMWAEVGLYGALLLAGVLWVCGCGKSRSYESMV